MLLLQTGKKDPKPKNAHRYRHRRSQGFWLGGGPNHKSYAMTSPETSKDEFFVVAKIS